MSDKLFDKYEIGDRVRLLSEAEGNSFGNGRIGGLQVGMEGEVVAIGQKNGTAQLAHIKWPAGVKDESAWYVEMMLGYATKTAKKGLTAPGLKWHSTFDESANTLYGGLAEEYKKHLDNLSKRFADNPISSESTDDGPGVGG